MRAMKSLSHIVYLFKIFFVLARNNALFFIAHSKLYKLLFPIIFLVYLTKFDKGKRKGERLTKSLQSLGPSFIKLGQTLSVRPDIIGEEVASDLSKLQDRLPHFSEKYVREILISELGENFETLFSEFNYIPVAAASIAQVHFATLTSGEKVAVKILRPNIEKKFKRDLDLFYFVANLVTKFFPATGRLKLSQIVKTLDDSTKLELDLRLEAAAASELKENMANEKFFKVPNVYWRLTSSKVMVLERVYGTQIHDKAALIKAGLNPDEILKKSAEVFMKQVLRDGFFHADMHPGNVFVSKKAEIVVIDFGIMGRIDFKTRLFLAEMLKGFLDRDYKKVSDVHFDAGYIPQNQSRDLFAQACRSIGEPIHNLPQSEISLAKLLEQLFKISEGFQMETQPHLLLLQKTMMMAEGIGRQLNPNVNFWELSREFIEDWGKEHLGPAAKAKFVVNEVISGIKTINNYIKNLETKTSKCPAKNKKSDNFWKYLSFGLILALVVLAVNAKFYN
jgi:ubiquinone biosynthesis protein